MLKLDNDLLAQLGLGSLSDDQKQAMLQYIYEILELRVGTNLANQMTDEQLDEFEKFIDDKGEANQAQALQWLEANLPNYKDVVNEVFEQLKVEIRQMAPQLLASTPQQMGQMPNQPPLPGGYVAPAAPYPSYQDPYASQPPMSQAPYGPTPMPAVAQQPGAPAPPLPVYADPGFAAAPQPPQNGLGPQGFGGQPPQPQPIGGQPTQVQSSQSQPPQQPQDDDQTSQLPRQQPPAGPGGYPQRPNS